MGMERGRNGDGTGDGAGTEWGRSWDGMRGIRSSKTTTTSTRHDLPVPPDLSPPPGRPQSLSHLGLVLRRRATEDEDRRSESPLGSLGRAPGRLLGPTVGHEEVNGVGLGKERCETIEGIDRRGGKDKGRRRTLSQEKEESGTQCGLGRKGR